MRISQEMDIILASKKSHPYPPIFMPEKLSAPPLHYGLLKKLPAPPSPLFHLLKKLPAPCSILCNHHKLGKKMTQPKNVVILPLNHTKEKVVAPSSSPLPPPPTPPLTPPPAHTHKHTKRINLLAWQKQKNM